MTYFLSSLGVLDSDQVRPPTPDAFPLAFNPNNKRTWDAIVRELKPSGDPARDWDSAIDLYIDRCVDYPFSSFQQSANDAILRELNSGRVEVVKFVNQSKILDLVTLKTSGRSVGMISNGFVLKVWANARIKDPTFVQWLGSLAGGHFRQLGRRWIKPLGRASMFVYNEGANLPDRWVVGYEIVLNRWPSVPGNPLPTQAEMEKFVLDVLWNPILRSHRPHGAHRRLF